MKVKFDCSFTGAKLAKDGEYKIEFAAPLTELSNVLSVIRMLNKRFAIALVLEGSKNKFNNAAFHRMAIDSDGETKVVFSIPYEDMQDVDLGFFGRCQQKHLTIYCRLPKLVNDGKKEDQDDDSTDEAD